MMFPSSVFFKLANVIDYDPFFLPMYSVISEKSLVILKNGVKYYSFTIVNKVGNDLGNPNLHVTWYLE